MIYSIRTIRKTSIPTRHSMIGSPERVKIQRSSIPKIRKIHSCVWKLYVKNSQKSQFLSKKWPNFRLKWPKFRQISIFQAYRVWFTQRGPQEQLPYQNLGIFIVAFGSYRPKTLKLALNGQNFASPWPNICHIRIFPVYRVWITQRKP